MIEDLKTRSATLAEVRLILKLLPEWLCPFFFLANNRILQVDVDLITYDLFVRAPERITEKYTIETYDEPNVASMVNAYCQPSHRALLTRA
jgi:hypothetical protein